MYQAQLPAGMHAIKLSGDSRQTCAKHNLLNLELSDDEEDLNSTSASDSAGAKDDNSSIEDVELSPTIPFRSPEGFDAFDAMEPLKVECYIEPPPGLEFHGDSGLVAPPGFAPFPWHRPVPVTHATPTTPERPAVAGAPKIGFQGNSQHAAAPPVQSHTFEAAAFHKDLTAILRDLVFIDSSAAAVRRVREWQVPRAMQAQEFADILTRSAEEPRGLARRRGFAFAAGLGSGKADAAFARKECIDGLDRFFREVYEELCYEVPRLPSIVSREMIPTLALALPRKQMRTVIPGFLWGAMAQGNTSSSLS